MGYPEPIFSCGTLGNQPMTTESVEELVAVLQRQGINHLETAVRHTQTEEVLGENNVPSRFTLDTKIRTAGLNFSGSLAPKAVDDSIAEQFPRLGVSQVNTLFYQAPDLETPLEDQLATFDKHYRDGRFKHFGISNFPAKMVAEMIEIAERKGFVKPTVYQGQYDIICYGDETELFPLLKKHGTAYNAYRSDPSP